MVSYHIVLKIQITYNFFFFVTKYRGVHLFGGTSSASCAAYVLKGTAIDNEDLFEPEVAAEELLCERSSQICRDRG